MTFKKATRFRHFYAHVSCSNKAFGPLSLGAVGQNNQKYRLKYWASRSSVRSYVSLCSRALLRSFVRSLTHSQTRGKQPWPRYVPMCILTHHMVRLSWFKTRNNNYEDDDNNDGDDDKKQQFNNNNNGSDIHT